MNKQFFHKIKAWFKALTHRKQIIDSPWQEFETLSLVPLEEIEEMIKKEEQKHSVETQQETQTKSSKREALSQVTHESQDPHVADLSHHYETLPTVITCFSDEDGGDPNLRITHYPPSNALH